MPIYMDVHIVPGVNAKEVAEAHRKDLFHQDDYGCKCMTYWIDEKRESIFCLIEAKDKDAVKELHSKAHGLVPNKIIEVSSSVVESFLGRIYDPEEAATGADGLKVFSDPSYRVLLVIQTGDPVLAGHRLGKESAAAHFANYRQIIRRNIAAHQGSETEQAGPGFVISFTSVAGAISCALAILRDTPDEITRELAPRLGIDGGEPVEKSNLFFGDAIRLARQLSMLTHGQQVAISNAVRGIIPQELIQVHKSSLHSLTLPEEEFLIALFDQLEANWQDPAFDIPSYCKALAMSQSQLYRKTIALTGYSANILLKDHRLEKARELLHKKRYSISQITFEAGFSSPSYFTKCFKKKYGLLPMAYLDLLPH